MGFRGLGFRVHGLRLGLKVPGLACRAYSCWQKIYGPPASNNYANFEAS